MVGGTYETVIEKENRACIYIGTVFDHSIFYGSYDICWHASWKISAFACVGYRDDDGSGWDVGDSGHNGGMVKNMLKLPFSVHKPEKLSIKISMLLAL